MKKLFFSLSALAIVAASQAVVHYHYQEAGPFAGSLDVTTSTFITSSQSFDYFHIDSANFFLSVVYNADFNVNPGSSDTLDIGAAFLGFFPYAIHDEFQEGAFGAYGTYSSTFGTGATLTVTNTPSPAAMVPFALGGLAALRKRRRATR